MPVTIGNLTSNVNVADGNSLLFRAAMEQLSAVEMRLREERYAEKQSRQEGEIRGSCHNSRTF
jgi:hypothetical protein